MLTPKQQAFLTRLQASPQASELLRNLQCEPVPSQEYKRSIAITARVNELMDAFAKKTWTKRFVLQENPINDIVRSSQISLYLNSLYGPKPWTYPLPFAPF